MTDSRKPLDHWLAPEGAGKPLACLATSFTFQVDFFEQQCLGRFLGLDWKRDEGDDLAFLIEQEEKLAETRVSVVVDRASAVEGRSLRWDLIPVGVRGGVMHAKVCLLVWERLVRGIVGSPNLTPAGYRNQLEAQIMLDASPASDIPNEVTRELIEALRELVSRAPGTTGEPGPKRRAFATLEDAERRLAAFGERTARRGSPSIAVILGAPERPVLDHVDRIWRGGPPRSATVLSPFFDATDEGSPAVDALAQRLAARGHAEARFVVAAEQIESRVRIQAPSSLLRSLGGRVRGHLHRMRFPDDEEERLLHAKAMVLESDHHVAALLGSSNFTAPGLGIGHRANLEINVGVGAARDSEAGKALRALIPMGDQLALEEVDWAPDSPEEEQREPELPWGFVQAVVDPLPEPTLRLALDHELLPRIWAVADHLGRQLTHSGVWEDTGRRSELHARLPDDTLPFFLMVTWTATEGEFRATWPVNVADAATLPPPAELRNLPVDVLLRALASTRPLHESLTEALRSPPGDDGPDDLDPLRRFSETGQLLRRAKQVSLALTGLRDRLERPAASEEALVWRLEGPFGPVGIGEGLAEQARVGGAVHGETSFLLAELALTLARVDWERTGRLLEDGTRIARECARRTLIELMELRNRAAEDPRLSEYIEHAFEEAQL